MSKYNEYFPSELGLIPDTNWTWFRMRMGEELWYTNGHVAMKACPVSHWPESTPHGMTHRRGWYTDPAPTPRLFENLRKLTVPLEEVRRTDRQGRPQDTTYQAGFIVLKAAEGTEHHVARHYYSLLRHKAPGAVIYGSNSPKEPVICRSARDELVAVLMPLWLPTN